MLASRLKLPVLDADGMGRAFPEMQMETFSIYGVSATPLTLVGNEGNSVIMNMTDAATAEKLIRQFTILGGGGACFSAEHVMDGSTVKQVSVPDTISLSLRTGALPAGKPWQHEKFQAGTGCNPANRPLRQTPCPV